MSKSIQFWVKEDYYAFSEHKGKVKFYMNGEFVRRLRHFPVLDAWNSLIDIVMLIPNAHLINVSIMKIKPKQVKEIYINTLQLMSDSIKISLYEPEGDWANDKSKSWSEKK